MFLGFRWVVDSSGGGWEGLGGFCAVYATFSKGLILLLVCSSKRDRACGFDTSVGRSRGVVVDILV